MVLCDFMPRNPPPPSPEIFSCDTGYTLEYSLIQKKRLKNRKTYVTSYRPPPLYIIWCNRCQTYGIIDDGYTNGISKQPGNQVSGPFLDR